MRYFKGYDKPQMAIIDDCYSMKCSPVGFNGFTQFSVFLLNDSGEIYDMCSWYKDDEMELIDSSPLTKEGNYVKIIAYLNKRNEPSTL